MKYLIITLFTISLVATGFSLPVQADSAFDSETQAKLARFKARKKLERFQQPEFRQPEFRGFRRIEGETPCGAIDLGNVENSTVLRGADGVTIIIDGDVINADNHCR